MDLRLERNRVVLFFEAFDVLTDVISSLIGASRVCCAANTVFLTCLQRKDCAWTVNRGRRHHAHVMEDLMSNGDAFAIPEFWQQSSLGPIEVHGGLSELGTYKYHIRGSSVADCRLLYRFRSG